MRRDRVISYAFCGINVWLHLIFVLDIVSTLVVAAEAKRVLISTRA